MTNRTTHRRTAGALASAVAALFAAFVLSVGGGIGNAYADAPAPGASADPSAGGAVASVQPGTAKSGETVNVTGSNWTPGALVQAQICGENALMGSADCAQASAAIMPVGADGRLNIAALPVTIPPKPCPCVVRVATVTGGTQSTNVPLDITGAPSAPLPTNGPTPARLVFLDSHLAGSDTIFTWFGSPVHRDFVIDVGNMGGSPLVNPVFKLGTYEDVYAPSWQDDPVTQTIQPGQKTTVTLSIDLKPRQYGHFAFRVMYGDQIVDEEAMDVARPWGVYLFFGLIIAVVPMVVWRLSTMVVGLVGEMRDDRATSRARDVGLPGNPVQAQAEKGRNASTGVVLRPSRLVPERLVPEPVPTPLPAPAPEPVLVPGGGRPVRRVEETLVISGPLYAGSTTETTDEVAARVAVLTKPPETSGSSRPFPDDAPTTVINGTAPAVPPAEPTRRLPPARPVTPQDIVRALAWNAGDDQQYEGDGAG